MIYSTIFADFIEVVEAERLPEELKMFATSVGDEHKTKVTHVLMHTGTGAVYAYADNSDVLEEYKKGLVELNKAHQ